MKKYKSNRDGQLQRAFGVTEEEYNNALETDGVFGGCMACGSLPKTRALHLDHDHKIATWPIDSEKREGVWIAWPRDHYPVGNESDRLMFIEEAKTKPLARAKVKHRLKRLSARGILCWNCNAGLKKYHDDPERIHKLAQYLDNYYDFLNGVLEERNGFPE